MTYGLFDLIPEWLKAPAGILVFIGIISVVLFFLWRLASGHFITNLVMAVELERTARNEGTPEPVGAEHDDRSDDLVTTIKLKKGIWSAVTLQELWVDVFALGRDNQRTPIGRYETFAFYTPEVGRTLNLTPAEETQYSIYCAVKPGIVYEVKVTLMGERYKTTIIRHIQKFGCALLHKVKLRTQPEPTKVYHTASAITVRAEKKKKKKSDGISRGPEFAVG